MQNKPCHFLTLCGSVMEKNMFIPPLLQMQMSSGNREQRARGALETMGGSVFR